MRVGTGLLLLAIVAVLVRSSGYTALADAIAMGYLALATSIARRSAVGAPALRAVPVRAFPDAVTRA
jgi:hypothetical protein